ncbi:MAG: DUF3267 domain-containing protein [Clostridia bacterium]|nr:DUF3267 domain-containing protein [Clostridia bacterium]
MKSTWELPEGYGQKFVIDLKDNKKHFRIVNGLALGLMILLLALLALLLWEGALELSSPQLPLQLLVMALGYVAYIPLHELAHGVFMRRCSGRRANYGFTLVYAYAGSECYFTKHDHRVISLAPVTFWGVVFLALLFLLPAPWRWVAYLWQVGNLSGAAGDFYVFWRLGKEPDTILCQDTGVKMAIFDKR